MTGGGVAVGRSKRKELEREANFQGDGLGWDGTVYPARCLVTNIGEIVTLRIVESSGNC